MRKRKKMSIEGKLPGLLKPSDCGKEFSVAVYQLVEALNLFRYYPKPNACLGIQVLFHFLSTPKSDRASNALHGCLALSSHILDHPLFETFPHLKAQMTLPRQTRSAGFHLQMHVPLPSAPSTQLPYGKCRHPHLHRRLSLPGFCSCSGPRVVRFLDHYDAKHKEIVFLYFLQARVNDCHASVSSLML